MTYHDDDCPLCHGDRVVCVDVGMPDEPAPVLVDVPCRCTDPEPEPEHLTPIEEFLT